MASPVIDESTPFGRAVRTRLDHDDTGWLTTVSRDGTPQPNPIWFLHTPGGSLLFFSKPGSARIPNLARHPQAAFHLENAGTENVIILTGEGGEIPQSEVTDAERAAYDEKYAAGYTSLGLTPESFHADYSVALRFTPTKARGW